MDVGRVVGQLQGIEIEEAMMHCGEKQTGVARGQ